MYETQMPDIDEAMEEMVTAFHAFHNSVDEYFEVEPDRSIFDVHVSKNKPCIFRNGITNWPAFKLWDASYLRSKMGKTLVKIAETPHGNADAVATRHKDNTRYFVKPLDKYEPFVEFLRDLQNDSLRQLPTTRHSIRYAQAQNDNLRAEYSPLYTDVPKSVAGMTSALGREPDAVNMWLGSSTSTTAMHRDEYENVYAQIRGSKTFTLLPPIACACVNEQFLPFATYARPGAWEIEPDVPQFRAPVALWDPDNPKENASKFSALSKPLRIKLDAGDLLYLPACWYHKVSQENGPEGFCCSVNYWYDTDMDATAFISNAFIRKMAWTANQTLGQ